MIEAAALVSFFLALYHDRFSSKLLIFVVGAIAERFMNPKFESLGLAHPPSS